MAATKKSRAKSAAGSVPVANVNTHKVLLLDGHSLAFRAFFALPDTLVTSSGQVTNAVYGFTAMLIKLLADERPQGVVVCFDKGVPQFRVDRYAEYKAGRAATPDLFKQQLPLIREVIDSLRIPILELDGYEADDLLATLTRRCKEEGLEVILVTGDRDILQLVGDNVAVIMTRRGISDVIRYDRATVLERYGVTPAQWTDFVALKGESSDNLPGVPGIGDKTAAQLVNKYGDIEGVIAHAEELTPKLRGAIKERAEQVRINKELGRLLDDVSFDLDPAKLRLEPWDDDAVRALFASLEFRSLHERLKELKFHAPAAAPALEAVTIVQFDTEKDLRQDETVAFAWNGDSIAVADRPGEARILPFAGAMERLAGCLKDSRWRKIAHDAKALCRAALDSGSEIEGLYCDTKIAAYLLEPGSSSGYTARDTIRRYLGVSIDGEKDPQAGEQASLCFDNDGQESLGREAAAIRAVAPVVEEQLRSQGAWELAAGLEFPLVNVLARMEHAGILVDRDYLEKLNGEFGAKMAAQERAIQEFAGEEFNVNSNLQLQRILFEKLGLPKTRKIKTGYST
ncbi:MAG TPA: DNA polymerase, partial [Candidatus Binatia bacterium]|nr:DNA polymerase [Candidatus Binatia bacterium]